MQKLINTLSYLVLSLALALPAMAADYDLVILNGRVMDPETMLDATLNVGVKDGKIAVITKDTIAGKETIDAKGRVTQYDYDLEEIFEIKNNKWNCLKQYQRYVERWTFYTSGPKVKVDSKTKFKMKLYLVIMFGAHRKLN